MTADTQRSTRIQFFWKKFFDFQTTLSGACTFLMVLPIVLDVIFRCASGGSIPGAIEISELFLLCMTFFGLANLQYTEEHIHVDLLFMHFSIPVKATLQVMNACLCLAITVLFVMATFKSTIVRYEGGEFTATLYIRYWPFYLLACCCLLSVILATCCNFYKYAKQLVECKKGWLILVGIALASVIAYCPIVLKETSLNWEFGYTGLFCIFALLTIIFLRLPIAFAMMIVACIGLIIISTTTKQGLSVLDGGIASAMTYNYAVIPMFVLMGEFVLHARIGEDLFKASSAWLGWMPGGLAISSLCGCAGFAAICGDSFATALTMTSVALPEMKKMNYKAGFACACLAAGGTLGILIPPSVGFIFYAIVTEQSIGKLFMAGFLPGVLLLIIFSAFVYCVAKRHPDVCPCGPRTTFKEKMAATWNLIPMLMLVLLILGGMLAGFFTPTEGGAVGAFGTLVYALARRRLSWKQFLSSLSTAANITTKILFILMGVNMLGAFLATTQLPFMLADMVQSMEANRYVVLLCIVIMYIFLGCIFNVIPMMLLTLPAIFPTVLALGFDPIWFGVIIVLLMEMGQITPPIGVVVFSIAGMNDSAPMGEIFRNILPFIIGILICLLILTIFPDIALFLPNALM